MTASGEEDAPGGGVFLDADDVLERAALRLLHVGEDGAGGAQAEPHVAETEAVEIRDAEVVAEGALSGLGVEVEVVPRRHDAAGGGAHAVGEGAVGGLHERLDGREADEFVGEARLLQVLGEEGAGRRVDPREPGAALRKGDGGEVVVPLFVEDRLLDEGAGGDDADDGAVDEALGLLGILGLLADGDAVAGLEQAVDVGRARVVGDAGHRDAAVALGAGGEHDAEHARGGLRVLVEHLVEVAEAEEEDLVRVLRLDGGILLHQRSGHGTGV